MPVPPSKCKRCQEKQIKCDEARPKCHRCTSAGIECPGYAQHRFVDENSRLRRRYGKGNRARNEKNTSSYHKNGFLSWRVGMQYRRSTRSVNPSRDITKARDRSFVHSEDSALQTAEHATAFEDGNDETILESDQPFVYQTDQGQSGTRLNHLQISTFPSILENSESFGDGQPTERYLPHPGDLSQQNVKTRPDETCSDFIGNEFEVQYLLRHYSNVIGPWLDLSNSDQFFTVHVPIRANDNLSLKYTVAAFAAKHLGRVKSSRSSSRFDTSTGLANMNIQENGVQIDWSLRAEHYHKMATAELSHITLNSSLSGSSMATSVRKWMTSDHGYHSLDLIEIPRDVSKLRTTEELLVSLVLLTLYKLIDENAENWPQHLSEIGPLFETIQNLHTDPSPIFSLGIQAAFWTFVRLDLFSSYFNRCTSYLDPENLTLWRAAGIKIDDGGGFQLPLREGGLIQEYQAANVGLWLVFKIVNFLAKQKQAQMARWVGSPPISLDGRSVQSPNQHPFPDPAVWLRLCFELQAWFDSLPETFRPFLRTEEPKDPSTIERKPIPEIFYGRSACAAAIQHYHFGRIALLLNQPMDPINSLSTSFDRLRGEVEFHTREICGIALGRPPDTVRIFMIPILFAVGQCLENPDEHLFVVNLLRSVETDLGGATDYTIQRLQAFWSSWHRK
ncbi:transcriptional regulator family: Fungal Specific TF [Penicillium odoratum]|uniref:transcriptional regulator family: Fungal Specific TF n=1 Tax=Penicillium odoratum TaxID=1167516 RepID=UPI002546C315|nr:transcriptional regulator family: Fungal Specific TF [Penicillium odoratum]KAJ5778198.1 transcriptional regulator family: Fungal Specific TF [Penicillium odoratum]